MVVVVDVVDVEMSNETKSKLSRGSAFKLLLLLLLLDEILSKKL